MFKRVFSVSGTSILALAFAVTGCVGAPDDTEEADSIAALSEPLSKWVPEVPDPSLVVPAGNKLAFQTDAIGVQIYACQASASGFAWVFQAPQADLFKENGRLFGTHYVGPTWQAKDGSKVVAARVAGFTVDPSSIPWLLLVATTHEGEGKMANVSYIQRLYTAGGIAPTGGCDAEHVGALANVDYTATYYFYKAKH